MGALGPPMRDCLRHRGLTAADVCSAVLIVAVLTLAFLPILRSLDKFPVQPRGNDWFKECAFNRSAREAILRDRQFPLRTQYLGGGYPLVAYPEDSSLNPLFVTTLLFGENAGLKLRVFIKLLVGALGMYYLLRAGLGCLPGGAAIGSLFFGLADWFHARTGYGYIGWHNYYFLPLMLGLLVDAARGKRGVVLPSFLFALMLIDGKFVVAVSVLFLCLWGIPEVVRLRGAGSPRRWAIVIRFTFVEKLAMVVSLGCLLSMAKILPMLELLRTNPRSVSYVELVSKWYVRQDIPFTVFYDYRHLWHALVRGGPPEYGGIGVGWIPLGLALLCAVLRWRVAWRWLLLLMLFAWLCMGYFAPVDLWRLLWHLPVFGSVNKPTVSVNFFILMPVCVLAASLFRCRPRSKAGWVAYGSYLCVGAVAAGLLLNNAYRSNAAHFTAALDVEQRTGRFFQVQGGGGGRAYHHTVQNIGTIDWDGDILLPEYAIPAWFIGEGGARRNEEYLGEVWLVGGPGSEVRPTRFTANAIDLDVRCAEATTVVINQNFHPGWHSSVGEVRSQNGLLAVADVPPGDPQVVRLRYSSRSFLIGLAVSALTSVALLWRGMAHLKAYGLQACLMGTDPPEGYEPTEVEVAFGAWGRRTRLLVALALAVCLMELVAIAVPALRLDYALRAADMLYMRGHIAQTAQVCREVLRSTPTNRHARELLGWCYHHEQRWEEAAVELRRAIKSGKPEVSTYKLLADSCWRLGKLAEAQQTYLELLAAYPGERRARTEYAALREGLQGAPAELAPTGEPTSSRKRPARLPPSQRGDRGERLGRSGLAEP